MGLIFAAVSHLHLPYPMDSSFLLALSACICSLLYIGTLLLNVQYRGDFGLITDPSAGTVSAATLRRIGNSAALLERHDGDLLSTPLRDINLLFSTVVVGYGTKLHNLKVDLKDV
jgi:hypothetical protein